MSMKLAKRVVERFGLTKDQRDAALERGRDVIVMAGAGSGKTRTLVARYASLLGEGLDPRRVVAITFTEKAALEMRSRVRDALTQLIRDTQEESERQQWTDLSARMDSARIGTIHSLCAEILRAHPADAGIDPRFDVLDEGLTSALQAQVVQDTLDQFAQDQKFLPLFTILETRKLVDLMQFLLKHRLEASECFANAMDGLSIVRKYIIGALNDSAVAGPISELRSMSLVELKADKLDEMVGDLLALWKMAEDALAGGNAIECAQFLYQARREKMNLQKGKKNSVTKEIIHALRDQYDALLDPVVGGKEKDSQVDSTSEKRLSVINPIIKVAFEQLQQNYLLALDQRQALDFDGLEAGAAKLLTRDEVRYRWQKEFDALLVDEFQDTNVRQRYIVEALAGNEGRMFIVGDARQSIYRFRQADVTVFRGIRQRVQDSNGFVRNLDLSFRAHEPLLQVTEDLLKHVMGDREDPSRPYYVPFSHLEAYRKEAPENFHSPHIELILGAGDDVSSARPVMATALARRLAELKREKQIQSWDEVALLFRTSTTYAYYEDALEELGIPFVTVAGRGFYDRPEIRDVVNILHALVDPLDNLAMAGLLRSPAFGLTDAALYLLRKQGQDTISYWTALQGNPDFLDEINYELSKRTVEIMKQLLPQVNRIPVAALIKQLMDATDYRAILASQDNGNLGGRLWRNLDKLIADAYAGGHVNVRDFLDYLSTLNDSGAREGEAPAETHGAVRLMTIHKAKGLEFPVVVLADTGHADRARSNLAYLLPETGLAVKLEPEPMLYRLAQWQDGLQEDAESLRILYVAMTRAKEKLIISGHLTSRSGGEWLDEIVAAIRVDTDSLLQQPGRPLCTQTASGHPIRAIAHLTIEENDTELSDIDAIENPSCEGIPLFQPLSTTKSTFDAFDESDERRLWRATGEEIHLPPGVIGQLVHKAIELWLFPGDSRLVTLLETAVLSAGLASSQQRVEAIRRTMELLGRLRSHPIWEDINSAESRYHEIPYLRMVGERSETGYIDLLYKHSHGWHVVDFKTDSIRTTEERDEILFSYKQQMDRYFKAVFELLKQKAEVQVCFLNDHENVSIVTV